MEQARRGTRRHRAYPVIGLVIGVLFLGLAAAAYFGGGGPFIAIIAGVGGVLCIAASVVAMVRARA